MRLHTALSLTAAASLAAALLLAPADRAAGCAVAPHAGQYVQIADESAIIIWDAASQTQHFIRRATFASDAHDFGFLVPTPSKPELAEAGDEAFTTLADLTKPRVIATRSAPSGGGGCGCSGVLAPRSAAPAGMAEPQVSVLESKRVGAYHADVLEADDAGALAKWLKEHGYESSPALAEWATPYVKAKGKFSAFKIARDGARSADGDTAPTGKAGATSPAPAPRGVSTSAVRMTFHTERPYFPYREPPGQPRAKSGPDPRRLLRVYFLAEGRTRGTLGEDAGGQDWPGRVVWSNALTAASRETVLGQLKLPEDTAPATWWLTEFEDRSSPRPGRDDVYFHRDVIQQPVERPPVYASANAPACVMCYALGLHVLVPGVVRAWRRRARGSASRG